ncbi:MAG: GNAT family N-acetyltransferase [Lachnospiraceae bacterium]|nr:GNAT family N-acetyltransferase [Lachnospiraceae bacterium]
MNIVLVDYDNSMYFSELAPEHERACLALPYAGGLGALVEEGDSLVPAGLLIYEESEDEELIIRWLYVLERFRYKGIGERLLAELCSVAGESGYEGISVFFCEDVGEKEYLERYRSYFTEKGFSNEWKPPVTFIVGADKVTTLPFLSFAEKQALEDVHPLSKINATMINGFLGLKGIRGLRASDFEQNTSCGIIHDNKLKGLYLVLKGGNFYMPVMCIADSNDDTLKLMAFAILGIADNMTARDFLGLFDLNKKERAVIEKIFEDGDFYETYALSAETSALLKELEEEVE